MGKVVRYVQTWMLPAALVSGVCLFFAYRAMPGLHPAGPVLHTVASESQRFLVAVLLFCQFVKISPHDLRLCPWHFKALAFQVLTFAALTAAVAFTPAGTGRILLECAMICFICPAAAASGVITEKLGGSLAETVTYVTVTNIVATFLIPFAIPIVCPSSSLGFWAYAGHIAWKVFPILVLPALVAWVIRYTTKKLQRRLMRWSRYAFYIWGVCLTIAMMLATRCLMLSGLGPVAVLLVVLVSLGCCALQFFIGKRIGRSQEESISAGQSLGQKNTGFLIWLGYSYMTPVTSVAGGLYAIWQNLYNSWELAKSKKGKTSN